MEAVSPTHEEEAHPLLSSTSAISTSPYIHRDSRLRSSFLAQKHRENQELEKHARQISSHNTIFLSVWDTFSAITIYATMLIRLHSIVGCALTVGATLIAYYYVVPNYGGDSNMHEWNGQLPTVLLSFAIITPLGQSISMAFNRREKALKALSTYRSCVFSLYVAHSSWDWSVSSKGKGRRGCVENEVDEVAVYGNNISSPTNKTQQKYIDWLNHSDTTLRHLTQLSDSLYQYLTLPTATRARHRATSKGQKEADEVLSSGHQIFTHNVYGNMIMISQLSEALKYRGLPGNEASRMRQWENSITSAIEDLRIVKEYRTLQALRVFERLFTLLLPPFYATQYVQIALDTNSLPLGIAMGVITSVALTGLFECVRQLEDPFVSHITLDGIDIREELVVLSYQELMVARRMLFPEAEKFGMKRNWFGGDVKNDAPENVGSGNEEKEKNDRVEVETFDTRRSRHERGS